MSDPGTAARDHRIRAPSGTGRLPGHVALPGPPPLFPAPRAEFGSGPAGPPPGGAANPVPAGRPSDRRHPSLAPPAAAPRPASSPLPAGAAHPVAAD